jgi:hypothetical protein
MLSEINAALPPSELLHGASDVNMTTAIGIFDWTDTIYSDGTKSIHGADHFCLIGEWSTCQFSFFL